MIRFGRSFDGLALVDIGLPRRLVLRLFLRPNWLWPYWSRRRAIFGAGPLGVMVMHRMTPREIAAFNGFERRYLTPAVSPPAAPTTEGGETDA